MTWQEFVTRVNYVLDAMEAAHDAVDVDLIDILGSDTGGLAVDVVKRADGRFSLIVE